MTTVQPIRKKTVVELAIEKIHELIRDGNLRDGDRLPTERELSEALGISRVSLREAIRVLDMMGIIRVEHGSGMVLDSGRVADSVVKPLEFALLLHRGCMDELFEARKLIEVECAGLAAERATPAQVQEMNEVFRRLEERRPDREAGISQEMQLHECLARAAGNTVLTRILVSIRGLLSDSRHRTTPASGVSPFTIELHRQLLRAVEERNREEARRIMRAHLDEVYHRLQTP